MKAEAQPQPTREAVRSPAPSAALSTSPTPIIPMNNIRIELDSFGRVSGISDLTTGNPVDLRDGSGKPIDSHELSIIPAEKGKSTLLYSPSGRVPMAMKGFLQNSEVHEPAEDRTKMQVSAIDAEGVKKPIGQYDRKFPSQARELASQIMGKVVDPARAKFEEQEQKIEDRAPPPSLSSEENRSSVKWGVGLIVIGVLCMGLGPLAPVGIALVAVGAFMLAGPAMDVMANAAHKMQLAADKFRPSEADMAAKMTKDALRTPEVRAQLEEFGLNPKDIEAMLGGDKGIKNQVKANGLKTLPPSYEQAMGEPSRPLPPPPPLPDPALGRPAPDSSLQPAGPVPPPGSRPAPSQETELFNARCLSQGWKAMGVEFWEDIEVSDRLRQDVIRLGALTMTAHGPNNVRDAVGRLEESHEVELNGVRRGIDNKLIEMGGNEMGIEVSSRDPKELIRDLHQLGGAIARDDDHIEELKAKISAKYILVDERGSVYEEPVPSGSLHYGPRTSPGHAHSSEGIDVVYEVAVDGLHVPSESVADYAATMPLGFSHVSPADLAAGYIDMGASEEAPPMHAQHAGMGLSSSPLPPAAPLHHAPHAVGAHLPAVVPAAVLGQPPFGPQHAAGQPTSLAQPVAGKQSYLASAADGVGSVAPMSVERADAAQRVQNGESIC